MLQYIKLGPKIWDLSQFLGFDPIFGKNPNFWDLQPLGQGIGGKRGKKKIFSKCSLKNNSVLPTTSHVVFVPFPTTFLVIYFVYKILGATSFPYTLFERLQVPKKRDFSPKLGQIPKIGINPKFWVKFKFLVHQINKYIVLTPLFKVN